MGMISKVPGGRSKSAASQMFHGEPLKAEVHRACNVSKLLQQKWTLKQCYFRKMRNESFPKKPNTPVTSVPRVLFLFLARSLHWFTAAAAPSQSLHVVPQRRWVRATVLRAWTHALDAPDRRNRLPSASARIEVAAMVPRLKKQLTMIRGCKNRGKFWAKYGNSYENHHGNCYYRHIKLSDSCRFLLGSQKGWYQWR